MCPARLTEIKGQDVLIEALARMQAPAAVKLVLVGSAQGREAYLARLQELVAAHGLQGRVVFAGLENDMATAYAASDAAVVPSTRAEPFGRTIIEAQAASLPVIASDAGGFRETVVTQPDGQSGWLVTPGDRAALAATLDQLVSLSDGERASMGENGRRNAAAHFTQDALCQRTLGVYQGLLAK
jgi:glycosyltransferase involved in cell wall biosynthesis